MLRGVVCFGYGCGSIKRKNTPLVFVASIVAAKLIALPEFGTTDQLVEATLTELLCSSQPR
jgi:hypothetical protein